jgi:hypothetical protein
LKVPAREHGRRKTRDRSRKEDLQLNTRTDDDWTCVWKVHATELATVCLEWSMPQLSVSQQLTVTGRDRRDPVTLVFSLFGSVQALY